jgi:transposase
LVKDEPIKNLIFLDESGANLQMSPIYGRAKGKERVSIHVPYKRGKNITMISAISIAGVEAAYYGEGSTDGDVFKNFLEKCLCPQLKTDQIVIMDNVKFHQIEGVKELIEARGAKLIYLPPYSPELNPIEEMWSKIKTILRKHRARTLAKFEDAIKIAFESVNTCDLEGWFAHAGYRSTI